MANLLKHLWVCSASNMRHTEFLQMVMTVAKLKDCNYRCLVQNPLHDETGVSNSGVVPSARVDASGSIKTAPPFILGEGLPPTLVLKIRRGDFVDMAELLRDNMEAERRRAKEGGSSCSSSGLQPLPSRRELVPDILSWIQCLGVYACIVANVHPEKVQQLLAYQTMLVHEARRCSGNGWQIYDTMFWQKVANDSQADGSKLNSSLYSVTFMAHQNGRGKTCIHCLETGHLGSECALASAKS